MEKEKMNMGMKKEWWGAGLTIFDSDNTEIEKRPLIIRKAIAFKKVLREMPIKIEEDELVVGNMLMGSSGTGKFFPDYATEKEKENAASKFLSIYSVYGHNLPDYSKILEVGVEGIKRKANQSLEELRGENNNGEESCYFLEAVIICCNAVIDFAKRYAELADELKNTEININRKKELENIAKICRHVPEKPAKSFYEAIQSFWFVFTILHNTLNMVPLGRFDQYMFPFYINDLKDGIITKKEGQELIECLWIKCNSRVQIKEEHIEYHADPRRTSFGRDLESKYISPTNRGFAFANEFFQQCVLGGQTSEGLDATNELTYMCLDATKNIKLTQPIVHVRLHRKSPKALLEKCCEVIKTGGGMPIISNDEVRIAHLTNVGIPLEEARDYAVAGCWEMLIPGKTDFRWSFIHALNSIEWIFNRGSNSIDGVKAGIDTGDITTFKSFDEILNAFKLQIDNQISNRIKEIAKWYGSNYMIAPVPFFSSMIEGCLEKGKDFTQLASKYIIHQFFLLGLPNAVDSLASIKKYVFDSNSITLSQIKKALDNNFKGYEDLRQRLLKDSPKFGNDDDIVDSIAIEVTEYFANRLKKHASAHTWIRVPGVIGSNPHYVGLGKRIGATPDGRKFGEAFASNFSPVWGVSKNGVTAVIKSFTKTNFKKLGLDSALDLSISPNFVKKREGFSKLIALIKGFMDLGGPLININVVSADTFRKAQEKPDEYRDLMVRMGGWQAFFVAIDREYQDLQILRVSHSRN
ncbi:MAG: pyruvate formate lyase family protein [Eubacteriales bacterium]